jgi:prepilin-type processing-associated H-X9-DG protein
VVIVLAGVVAASAWFALAPRTAKSVATTETPAAEPPLQLTTPTDLVRFLPTGAVVTVHYQGGEALRPAFQQSAIGQILNDPQMRQFLQKPKQALYKSVMVATNSPRPEMNRQFFHWVAGKESLLAVYIEEKPQVALCVRLGADAPKARAALDETLLGDDSVSKRTFHGTEVTVIGPHQQQAIVKDVFVFATETNVMDAVLERIGAATPPEIASMAPALDVGQTIGWAVVDIPRALEKARGALKDPDAVTKFDAIVKELGAQQIKQIEMAAGFDGPGIRTAARVSGLAPGSGLFALCGSRAPLDDAALRLIPKDAAAASAARIDLTSVWGMVLRIIELAEGHDGFQQVQSAIAEFEGQTQVHVKEDLIDSVGNVMVFYSKPGPMPMAAGEMGMVLGLKDPQRFANGIDRLLDYANRQLASNQPPQRAMSLSIQQSKVGDVDVRYLGGMPMFSPAFAVKGSNAFLAISPMALNASIAQAEQPQSSLLDNSDFQSIRAKLPEKAVAVSYEDTRQLAAGVYAMIATFGPMLAGRADAPVDLALLPPLSRIQEKLFGGVCVLTADDGEIVMRQYSSVGVNLSSFASGGVPIMAAMLLPALNQAREKARDANCASNLKQIGLACHLYADKHGGKFPDSLDQLVGEYLPSEKILHCPSSPNQAAISYGYCRGYTPKNVYRILAFDVDGNHRGGGRNVLFCDGHVEWMTDAKFHALLQKQM